jgi:hypothetical protein
MGIIRHIDYSTDRLPWGNRFEFIMHKDAYYRYEAEVRVVATARPTEELGLEEFLANHFSLTADPTFPLYAPPVDPSKLIRGIVLHPEASDEFAAKIRNICAEKGLPAPILSRDTAKPSF